ncbi:hypothetical protein KR044_005448, partial [Drosophila immigrans]
YLDQTANLVHPEWELVDPTPNVFAMFARFDEKFFQRRLGAVAVEWSKRMYSCAGICYQRGNRYVKEIIIRLSEPLLKLRPRKDLVETLLHEMIHAYCFVLDIREGNGGHGPNFKRIMTTINKVAGTNISVYHSFHDEVNAYKTHIWRCNGVCQFHHPFLGWVKRTSNRAPGPSDRWWAKHQADCGGVFEKMQSPTPTPAPSQDSKGSKASRGSKKSESKAVDVANDIRNYLKKPASATPAILAAGGVATSAFPPTSYPGLSSNPLATTPSVSVGNKRSNVRSFQDLNSSGEERPVPVNEMQGRGYSLGNTNADKPTIRPTDRQKLRDHWSQRFPVSKPAEEQPPTKRARHTVQNTANWEAVDDDVMIRDEIKSTITISDTDDDDDGDVKPAAATVGATKRTGNENISMLIKREIMEDESSYNDDDILMIDDEFNDDTADAELNSSLTAASELADQSVIDDLFGEDTLLMEFQRENDVVPSGSRYQHDERNDIITCPICFDKMKRSDFDNHLDGCSIIIKVKPPSFKGKTQLPISVVGKSKKTKARGKSSSNQRQILKSSGYSSAEIDALNLSSSSESAAEQTPRQRRQRQQQPSAIVDLNSSSESNVELTPRQQRQRGLHSTLSQCPKCGRALEPYLVEAHRKCCKG